MASQSLSVAGEPQSQRGSPLLSALGTLQPHPWNIMWGQLKQGPKTRIGSSGEWGSTQGTQSLGGDSYGSLLFYPQRF